MSTTDWTTGRELLDGYLSEGLLGRGGMGVVYRVRNALADRSYAVKRTHLKDPESQRHFLRELISWFDLPDHPNLVGCQFFRTVQMEIAIFAELVEGQSVYEIIKTSPTFR